MIVYRTDWLQQVQQSATQEHPYWARFLKFPSVRKLLARRRYGVGTGQQGAVPPQLPGDDEEIIVADTGRALAEEGRHASVSIYYGPAW